MSSSLIGQLLAVLSAVCFALANNFISRTTHSGGDKGVMFSVVVTMALSSLLWLALESGETVRVGRDALLAGIAWFALAGLCAMVFGRSLLYESVRRLGVARSTAVKRLNPFFSALLAALILAEPVTGIDGLGMAAIAIAFAILVRESLRRRAATHEQAIRPAWYLFGVCAALAYAFAYIFRKIGLDFLPSPAFGTLVSAVAGFSSFVIMAGFSRRIRANLAGVFSYLDRWIVGSAVMVSLGQILLFAALAYEEVSTVVMIASLEVFVSLLLSVVVFRQEPVPGMAVLLSAALATLGVVLVAA